MRHLIVSGLLVGCAVFAALPPVTTHAQRGAASARRCDAILTGAKAAAIAGGGFQGPAVREPRPGFTSCEWQGSDANFGFTFTSTRALQLDRQSADAAFETDVSAVESDDHKREMLTDIGVKAARVSLGDDAFIVVVQRRDGVARMTFYKIPTDKMMDLVRAVGTP